MIFNKFIFFTAYRYFKAKKREKLVSLISGFSLLGVSIGVAALIVVMSVMNGFHRELIRNIVGLNGDIVITPIQENITNYDSILEIMKEYNAITKILPSITSQVLVLGNRSNSGALIKGISSNDLYEKTAISNNIIAGSLENFEGNKIALGSELALLIGAKVGMSLKLISPNIITTAFGSMPRAKEFNVVAIFNSGLYDYDLTTILMPLNASRKFLSFKDNDINLIEIYTNTPEIASDVAYDIKRLLNEEEYHIISWISSNKQFLNALAIERVTMFTILSLIIIVAAFNIISSLIMLVKDKTKDIAILRTLGATKSQVLCIFMLNGMFIGMIGTIVGVILGVSFASNINNIRQFLEKMTNTKIFDAAVYFLYSLPSDIKFLDVLYISLLAILLCFLATIYPAYKAANLNPIEALRY